MRWIFCIHFTALLVCRLEACHHKHKTNKLGQPSASSNNNNVRTNLNTIGRRKRQTYNNVGSVGRNPTVTNTSPGLRNTRPGSDDGRALEPWSKLYWPLWFDCHRHRATGRLAFQVCKRQFAQSEYLGGFALTWVEARTCIEDYAYVEHGYGDPDEISFTTWDLDRNGQVTYEEWWEVEGRHHQGLC